jgi:hypothetical protein
MGTIKIKISPIGGLDMETEGFTGTACKDATEAIEKALMGDSSTVKSDDKPELFDTGDGQVQELEW